MTDFTKVATQVRCFLDNDRFGTKQKTWAQWVSAEFQPSLWNMHCLVELSSDPLLLPISCGQPCVLCYVRICTSELCYHGFFFHFKQRNTYSIPPWSSWKMNTKENHFPGPSLCSLQGTVRRLCCCSWQSFALKERTLWCYQHQWLS